MLKGASKSLYVVSECPALGHQVTFMKLEGYGWGVVDAAMGGC